jgi:hypothetical protein
MWVKIWTSLCAIGVIILGGFSLFFFGKQNGKKQEQQKQSNEVLNEVVETKKILDSHATDDINTVRNRVQQHNRD